MFFVDYFVFNKILKGEIDFMIIYWKIGVIFVEVKVKYEFSKSF